MLLFLVLTLQEILWFLMKSWQLFLFRWYLRTFEPASALVAHRWVSVKILLVCVRGWLKGAASVL